uniref:Uncharacterized protein n=1 Tax=Glossina pallidipes TaxID=7398 RepID=A0A1B0A7K3_GLOPL
MKRTLCCCASSSNSSSSSSNVCSRGMNLKGRRPSEYYAPVMTLISDGGYLNNKYMYVVTYVRTYIGLMEMSTSHTITALCIYWVTNLQGIQSVNYSSQRHKALLLEA